MERETAVTAGRVTDRYGRVLLCVAAGLLTGCAGSLWDTEAEALLPEIDIVQVKESSDEALRLAREATRDVEALSATRAKTDDTSRSPGGDVSDVSAAKIEELENRIALLVEAYKDLQARVDALAGQPQVRTKAGAASSPSSTSALPRTASEYDSYHNALRVYNSRDYTAALRLFTETLAAYPSGTYADNCQYWIGECYYATGDHTSAIAAFQKVFEYRNTSKADDAQLKIGLSYLKMGQRGRAKAEFDKLIDRYPGSEYVPRARKYLSEIE